MRIGAFSSQNFIQNNGGRNLIVQMNGATRFQVLQSGQIHIHGELHMQGDSWHHGQGRRVVYYESSGRNYYRGGSPNDAGITPHIFRNRDDTNVVSFTHWGEVRANSSFTNISDIGIKKDIEDVDEKVGLEKILLIEVKKYKYVDEATKGSHEVIGFITQQVKEIIPHTVNLGEGKLPDGEEEIKDFHCLDKMMIYTHNVLASQELHRMILRQQANSY